MDVMVIPAAGYYCRPTLPARTVGECLEEESSAYGDGDSSLGFSSKILVMEADDLLRIRARISSLYPEKRVIVAPCKCKLYLSRQPRVIDSAGTTSPDWSFFASGAVALIYTASLADLSIALFESNSTRLLWCLKWSSYSVFETPTANFHVLNTKADRSEHVGIWYENKNVAELMMSAVTLLKEETNSQSSSKLCKGRNSEPSLPTQRRRSLLRTLSLRNLRASKQHKHDDGPNLHEPEARAPKRKQRFGNISRRRTVETLIRSSPQDCSKPILREIERSRTIIESHDSYNLSFQSDALANPKNVITQTPNQENALNFKEADCSPRECNSSAEFLPEFNTETKVLRRLTRPGSFIVQLRKSENTSQLPSAELPNSRDLNHDDSSFRSESGSAGSRVRHLFQFSRRLSRSQSLRLPSSSCDSNVRNPNSNVSEQSRYQRSTKLQKPRAGTDTLLLQALTAKCVIDTGHMARYVRERKQWGKSFKNGRVESTDLCVTEL